MNIKILLLFLSIISFSTKAQMDKDVVTKNLNPEKIVGEWSICKRKSGDTTIMSNECHRVVFERDGKAHLYSGSAYRGEFSWSIRGKKIKFEFSDDRDNYFFDDTKFYYKLYVDKFEALELKHTKRDFTYFLLREPKGYNKLQKE